MMLQQTNINNYTKNNIMDNPDVTISDLFVDVKKSFAKFEKKQKLDKERRQKKKEEACAAKSNSASPLFGSQLNPQWNTKAESFSSTDSTAVTEKQLSTSSSADHPPPLPKKSMSESILAMLGSSSSYKSPPPVPDHSEMRRREEVAAAIRLKAAQLYEERLKGPPKPLEWSKPSFNFPSKDDGTNRSGDDDYSKMAAQPADAVESSTLSSAVSKQEQFSGRKRKSESDLGDESPDTATTAALPISNNCYHRPIRGAAIYTTSAAALPPQQTLTIRGKWRSRGSVTYSLSKSVPINGLVSYTNQHQVLNPDEYSKEDVDGLVESAQRYITANNMKRRRTK